MHLEPGSEQWPRWLELLDRVRSNLSSLVDDFMDHVRSLPTYQAELVPLHQVRGDASRIFAHLLIQMGDQADIDPRSTLNGQKLGAERARAGVPLGDLLAAVHLDSQILWSSLRSHTREDEKDILVAAVEIIWGAVENYTSNVQLGFTDEQALAAAGSLTERSRVVTAMLSNAEQHEEDFRNLAAVLGVEVDALFAVICFERAAEPAMRRVAQVVGSSKRTVYLHPFGGLNLLFVEQHHDDLSALLGVLGGIACAVAPIAHGVPSLRRSALLAVEAMELGLIDRPRPVLVESDWLSIIAARTARSFPELSVRVQAAFAQLREADRERLFSAACIYASCGSIATTAEQMFCHRNTILTRLNRIRTLTGYDITVPGQGALLQIALLAQPEYRSLCS